nr:hypothetical protein [Klebsiella pneumoniae]
MYELGVVYRNIQRADRAAADGLAAQGNARRVFPRLDAALKQKGL